MAVVISLNRVRKAKAKAIDRGQADANSAKFGRRREDKTLEAARQKKAERDLDGHKTE